MQLPEIKLLSPARELKVRNLLQVHSKDEILSSASPPSVSVHGEPNSAISVGGLSGSRSRLRKGPIDRKGHHIKLLKLTSQLSVQLEEQLKLETKQSELAVCPVCYTNEIQPNGKPVAKGTIELACKHRFCFECVRLHL